MTLNGETKFPNNHKQNGQKERKRVLLVAYAYSPTMGSEYRHAWELSRELSKHHEVTLLFGDSDGLMGSFESYNQYLATQSDPVRAIKIKCSAVERAIAKLMLRMPFSLLFAFLLRSWHKKALRITKELHAEQPFDVIHQLGPIGFRNPGYCWQLDALTYWGPIGGAQYINYRMVSRKLSFYFVEALLRNCSVWIQRFSPYIRAAAFKFDRLSFATPENRDYFLKNYGRDGIVISDQGLNHALQHYSSDESRSAALAVAWGGTLNARKNVDLLIAIAEKVSIDIEFTVMGDGPMRAVLEEAAGRNPRLKVLGRLDRQSVQKVLQKSDAILLTSLSEANTAILFEGMENECIPVAPRINGFAACLNDSFAITYDYNDWTSAVEAAAAGLQELYNPEILEKKRRQMNIEVDSLSWKALALKHIDHYE